MNQHQDVEPGHSANLSAHIPCPSQSRQPPTPARKTCMIHDTIWCLLSVGGPSANSYGCCSTGKFLAGWAWDLLCRRLMTRIIAAKTHPYVGSAGGVSDDPRVLRHTLQRQAVRRLFADESANQISGVRRNVLINTSYNIAKKRNRGLSEKGNK